MTFIYHRTIHFQDTDAAGVVYFANILAMCHEAYEDSLAASGIDLRTFFTNSKFAIPIVQANINFRSPLFCGDKISIQLTPQSLNEQSFQIHYQINLDNDRLVAEAETKHICIHPKNRQRQQLVDEIYNWLTLNQDAEKSSF